MAFTYSLLTTRASSAGNPITFSLTVPAATGVMVLMIKGVGATNRAGASPTWGTYTFTKANLTQKAATSPEASAELWYLLNPIAGTATLTIPNTGAITIYYEVDAGIVPRGGSAFFQGANGSNGTSTNPTPGAVTTQGNGIGFAHTAGGWVNFSSATPVGVAIFTADDGADGGGGQYILNPPAGSHTLSWTFGTSDDWGAVSAYFGEIPPNAINNYMHFDAPAGISVGEKIR